jgi:hypothetical protein
MQRGNGQGKLGWVPTAETPGVAFGLWVAGFFATALAFVLEARGQVGGALLAIAVAVAWLLPLLLPRRTTSSG